MLEKYEKPIMEILLFGMIDIVTLSNQGQEPDTGGDGIIPYSW